MTEKLLTIVSIIGGTLLTYTAGYDIYCGYGSPLALGAYTIGVLALAAGVRSIVKSMEYKK